MCQYRTRYGQYKAQYPISVMQERFIINSKKKKKLQNNGCLKRRRESCVHEVCWVTENEEIKTRILCENINTDKTEIMNSFAKR